MDSAYSWLKRSVSKLKITHLPSSSGDGAAVSTAAAYNSSKVSKNREGEEEEEKIYGINEKLIEFVKSFSLETFNNFSLPDEESDINGGENGNLRRDLSDWQQTHAMLVLSKVKELAQLRFRLCPRYLKERQFWRIYFTLVWSYVAEYELHAIKLAKLKQLSMGNETVSNSNACEVEMSEAKFTTSDDSATFIEQK